MIIISNEKLNQLSTKAFEHYRRSATVMAVLLLICGMCCLVYPFIMGVYISYLVGFLFALCGLYALGSCFIFRHRGKKALILTVIFGLVWLIMGYSLLINPVGGMISLTTLICFLFIFGGISRIAAGISMRKSSGAGWQILIGLLDLIIAVLWLSSSETQTFIITTLFIGLEMLFTAWGILMMRRALPARF